MNDESPLYDATIEKLRSEGTGEVSIDLRGIVIWLWRGKWKIFATLIVFGAIGHYVSNWMSPSYSALAKVIFDTREEALASGAAQNAADAEILQNEIEILRSRPLVERVVRENDLILNPTFNPYLLPETSWSISSLFAALQADSGSSPADEDRANETTVVQLIGKDVETTEVELPVQYEVVARDMENQRRLVVDLILDNLRLEPVPASRVLEISYTASDAKLSAKVANAFAEAYIAETVDLRLDAMRGATEWLDVRVEALRDKVRIAEDKAESARADQAIRAAITAQQLEAQNASLLQIRNQMRRAQMSYHRLREAGPEGADLGALPEYSQSELLGTLRAQEADVNIQRADLLESVQESHLLISRADETLEDISHARQEEAWRITEAARLEWLALKEEEAALKTSILELQNESRAQSKELVEIRQLEREAEVRRRVYENFLGRLNETAEQSKFDSANARVLSAAVVPFLPITNVKKRAMIVCLVLGFIVGTVLVYLAERLSNTFRSSEQIENLTGERVLATLPAFSGKMRRMPFLKMLADSDSKQISETARMLRTNVLFRQRSSPPKIIMFTSTMPGEGKSTLASIMALSLSQMGRQTALIDGDLRNPSIKELFGLKGRTPGILSLLDTEKDPEDFYARHEDSGLDTYVIGSDDTKDENSADLLSTKKFGTVLDVLSQSYDHIVIDAPPAEAVADAWILAKYVDALVYVVRYRETPRENVVDCLKRLKEIGAPVSGIVMTHAKHEAMTANIQDYGFSPLLKSVN